MSVQTIWLASYPRSGNTLLRTVLYQCFGNYHLDIVYAMPQVQKRQAGVEVTPEMIEAGVRAAEDWLSGVEYGSEANHLRELVNMVVYAAISLQTPATCMSRQPPTAQRSKLPGRTYGSET